jgi:hypothetical protein
MRDSNKEAGVGDAGRMSIVRAVYLMIARGSRIQMVRGLMRGRGLRCRLDSRVLTTLQDFRRLTTALEL